MHPGSMSDTVREEGITVVYEPKERPAIADILLVHGLQGHPFKTWACPRPKNCSSGPSSSKHDENGSNLKGWQKVLPRRTKLISNESLFQEDDLPAEVPFRKTEFDADSSSIYWPRDLLANDCQNARILVYGYDTRITKYMTGATSKNTLFSHGKDLLFALVRKRPVNRPLIVIAHSLGGIVVKEMLAGSASSGEADTHDIVKSLAAIIFLGTPHRGSPELAAMGELARSLVSALRMETTSIILDALGLKTSDLERAQESFSFLWRKYDFRVKTFQEGLGLTGINLGVLGNKVVPGHSSLIGDHRERAETIHANHMNMCRFWGADDPNYTRVAGEICSVYRSIAEVSERHRRPEPRDQAPPLKRKRKESVSDSRKSKIESLIESLQYDSMYSRHEDIDKPSEGTCHWLFEHPLYQDWFHGVSSKQGHGLLRLRGKPGTGKSILMKEAFRQTLSSEAGSAVLAAAFFFHSGGEPLDRSSVGMFRSLLHQLLPQLFQSRHVSESSIEQFIATTLSGPVWNKQRLKGTLRRALHLLWQPKVFLFLDGLDACGDKEARELAFMLWDLTKSAREKGCDLRICLSSRHFPTITIADCPDIIVDDHNHQDLTIYMDRRFHFGLAANEPEWERLKEKILEKSAGVFLWVVLVVDEMVRQSDEGNDISYLLNHVDVLPAELEALYASTISAIPQNTKSLALRLFTWAVLAQKPLRLHEWHHILAFIKEPAPPSLRAWRMSDTFTRNDDQLEKQIRNISRGLVEVKRPHIAGGARSQDLEVQSISMCAGAGSLNLEHGESRVVQVIHESVRGFFQDRHGFSYLDPPPHWDGHICILETCMKYIMIKELDALVSARHMAALDQGPNDGRLLARAAEQHDIKTSALSHKQSPYFCPERPSPADVRPENAGTSAYAMLRGMFGPAIGADIHLWLASVLDSNADAMDVDEPAPNSPTQLSVIEQTQVLEDYPALLSYATSEIFTHAQLAQLNGSDPLGVIERLGSWNRLVALREDIAPWFSLYDYAAILAGPPSRTPVQENATQKDLEAAGKPNFRGLVIPDEDDWPLPGDTSRPYEREGSVASFGSAGSHMSHTIPSPIHHAHSFSEREPAIHVPKLDRTITDIYDHELFYHNYSPYPITSPVPINSPPGTNFRATSPTMGNGLNSIPTSPGPITTGYTCTFHHCSQRFETLALLQRHKREGHRAIALPSGFVAHQSGLYRCERINPSTGKPCNTVFPRTYDLTRHEDTIHNQRKQKVTCELCSDNKTFSRQDALVRHYRVNHPEADFPGKRRRRGESKEGIGGESSAVMDNNEEDV